MERELHRYESVAEIDKMIMIAQQDLKVGDRASRYGARKVDETNPFTKQRRAAKRRRNNCDDDDDDEKQAELEERLRVLNEAPMPPITLSVLPPQPGVEMMKYRVREVGAETNGRRPSVGLTS